MKIWFKQFEFFQERGGGEGEEGEEDGERMRIRNE